MFVKSIAGAQAAIDLIKGLLEARNQLKDLAEKTKYIELQKMLLKLDTQLLSCEELLATQEKKIHTLEKQLAFRVQLIFETPFYWHIENGKKEGPFCQHCYDSNLKPVRLIQSDANETELYHCTVCKNHFSTIAAKKRMLDRHNTF
jgi:hypothetical protein